MDKITKKQRSKNMSAIRDKGNLTTEVALFRIMRANKIKGWRRHVRSVYGRPDFVFKKNRVAIFVDGCFWHGCPIHKNSPKTNLSYWGAKIIGNKARDKKVNRRLKKEGWKVLRIWEHDIKKIPAKFIVKIKNLNN